MKNYYFKPELIEEEFEICEICNGDSGFGEKADETGTEEEEW